MPSFDVIIFDIDGTLVDSRRDIVRAVKHAFDELRVKSPPAEEIISYVGTGVSDLLRKCLGPENGALIVEAVRLFSGYFARHACDEAKLYPHVKEVLEHFKHKRKIILTNRYRLFAEATLKGMGIAGYFEDIISGDDETCKKPDACILDKAVSKLRIDRSRALIVGDMDIDIEMAKNSRMKSCWVTYGLGKSSDLKNLKPDYVINDMIELKDVVE